MKICGAEPLSEPLLRYSSELMSLVLGFLKKDPHQRPALATVLRSGFGQNYIKELLTRSLETRSGCCETLIGSYPGDKDPDLNQLDASPPPVACSAVTAKVSSKF